MEIITGKISIRQIFADHWEKVLTNHRAHIPEYAMVTVNKMLACRDPEKLGYAKYSCPDHPSEITVIPHSCKSRFCNACGNLQTERWINESSCLFPNVIYYHITFTIPDYLWYFLKGRYELIDFLFKASSQVILGWFKERNIIPAVCSALHSYGKDLKINYHIHLITTAGGLYYNYTKEDKPSWKPIDFLPYKKMLKERWKAILLGYLKPYLDADFKEMLYALNWYVYVNLRPLDLSALRSYIGRYAKKPVIAENRITDYDGKTVTFFYEERDNPAPIYSKLSAEEFILKLIQHISPPHFRIIRYYGLLANAVKEKYLKFISLLLRQIRKTVFYLRWRIRQMKFKGIDPLLCPVTTLLKNIFVPDYF
jgi:hypothetical protein